MIEIKFPANRADIALAIGQALMSIGTGNVRANAQLEHYAQGAGQSHADVPLGSFGTADAVTEEEDDAIDTGTASGKVDLKGVAYLASMCMDAKEPFYASGKNKGQWKKRKAVSEADYDAWYAGELGKLTTNPAEEPKVDLGTVWQAPASQDAVKPPVNAGELFAYVSEMQTAKRLTQADVDAAYPAVNLTVQQLWTADPATQSQMVAALFAYLSSKATA